MAGKEFVERAIRILFIGAGLGISSLLLHHSPNTYKTIKQNQTQPVPQSKLERTAVLETPGDARRIMSLERYPLCDYVTITYEDTSGNLVNKYIPLSSSDRHADKLIVKEPKERK